MKRFFLFSAFLAFLGLSAGAQKFAYVDTQYILDNVPEYVEAQGQIDELSLQFQQEIEEKFTEIDKMYKDFQAEAVLLPEDMKKRKENEIIEKEKEAKNLQKQRFGKDGDLFKKRQELVKPVQERVYNAIQEIATNGNYAVIFDKSGSLTMLYSNPKYDLSDDVLDNLGVSFSARKKSTPVVGSSTGTSNPPSSGTQQAEPKKETPSNTKPPINESDPTKGGRK
jgi:outer membrane protein